VNASPERAEPGLFVFVDKVLHICVYAYVYICMSSRVRARVQ
jgi:hypothetical protein